MVVGRGFYTYQKTVTILGNGFAKNAVGFLLQADWLTSAFEWSDHRLNKMITKAYCSFWRKRFRTFSNSAAVKPEVCLSTVMK